MNFDSAGSIKSHLIVEQGGGESCAGNNTVDINIITRQFQLGSCVDIPTTQNGNAVCINGLLASHEKRSLG